MLEILLAIFLPQLFILPILLAIRPAKNKKGAGGRVETGEMDGTAPNNGLRVFEILRLAHLDMVAQHGAGYGPWLSSALEMCCADPSVALTAVQWTIRDLLNLPVGDGVEYVEGLKFRFNLEGLYAAEAELKKIMGEGA